VRRGGLAVSLPDGRQLRVQGPDAGPKAVIVLHRWRALARLATQGDTGWAAAYRDGDWSTPDLPTVLAFGAAQADAGPAATPWPARLWDRAAHLCRANTRRGSRRNIAFHYDLGNDFFARWLDPQLIYSSALYTGAGQSLEEAQACKLARVLDLLRLDDLPRDARVLEIGCGWGALALTLARHHPGLAVTGVTLSAEQLAYARERVAHERMDGHVSLRLQDYRDVEGRYDRIVSIEMLEAVGERYWPVFFDTLRERLAPGGRAVIQVITIHDAHFEAYRRRPDFIQRLVFPGGMLPSPAVIRREATRAGLQCSGAETFGDSYAATLGEWRRRFLAAEAELDALGFGAPFRRLWDFYLCYCRAGFLSGRVDVGLYTFERALPRESRVTEVDGPPAANAPALAVGNEPFDRVA
jgi:cyclopropane-fatty-acyl-phospholipid synthase